MSAAASPGAGASVQVYGVLEVDTAEHREHVRLEKRDRQLESRQPDRQGERCEAEDPSAMMKPAKVISMIWPAVMLIADAATG